MRPELEEASESNTAAVNEKKLSGPEIPPCSPPEAQDVVAIEIKTEIVGLNEERHNLKERTLESAKSESEVKICRVCHLPLDGDGIELGCLCKNELSTAHRHCAATWFNIKGSKNCEICGQIVQNVTLDPSSCTRSGQSRLLMSVELNVEVSSPSTPPSQNEDGRTWKKHLCNLILALCVVIPFLPWLFRVRIFKF